MPQLIGGAILIIALVLFAILFKEGNNTSATIPSEASPAGCVLVAAVLFMLLAFVVCGIVLIFYRG